MALSGFHRALPKVWWFVLFNVGTVIYLIVSGTLQWNWISIGSFGAALLLINGVALISTRNFPDWKWTRKQQMDWDQKGTPPVNQSTTEVRR